MTVNIKGFAVVELLLVLLILGLISCTGYYVWNAHYDASRSVRSTVEQKAKSDNPAKTTTYTDHAQTFSVQYPDGWGVYETDAKPTLATDVAGFGPLVDRSVPRVVVTVSSYATSKPVKSFLADGHAQVLKSQQLIINGNDALYQETGDGTYVNVTYAISKEGRIVTVSMTQVSTIANAEEHNEQYMPLFQQIAKSVQLK